MAPKEPTRHQISSRLAYSQQTPSFLLKLQNRIAGVPDDEEEDDEYEDDGSGRPPIPRRPAIPERPDDEPGSADEDDLDEKPQVVVLKEGKHLTEWEAENERRREKGLQPLPDPSQLTHRDGDQSPSASKDTTAKPKTKAEGLSFSSAKSTTAKALTGKRKAMLDGDDGESDGKPKKTPKKKPKKAGKTLLSFGDDV